MQTCRECEEPLSLALHTSVNHSELSNCSRSALQGASATDSSVPAATPAPAHSTISTEAPHYTRPGPFQPTKLPQLEHICTKCFPKCQINSCMLHVDVWYPKGGAAFGISPPYPLAIFSSGFLVSSTGYTSYACMLASWGYTVLLYDKVESALSAVDDVLSVAFVSVSRSNKP
jgi:hypothetical protein